MIFKLKKKLRCFIEDHPLVERISWWKHVTLWNALKVVRLK
jgi:hypothetical protein